MTLVSDASREEYPDNKPSKFTTRLLNPIEFDGPWEAALVELSVPMKWTNVIFTKDNYMRVLIKTNPKAGARWYQAKISQRTFNKGADVASMLNRIYSKLLKRYKSHTIQGSDPFRYDEMSGLMTISLWHSVQVSPELARVLGLEGKTEWVTIRHYEPTLENSINPPDPVITFTGLHRGIYHIFAYTDIIEYMPVGDIIAPLLRVVPVDINDEKPGPFTYTVNHPHYVPISRQVLETINIDLRTDRGDFMPFVSGKTYCKLHLRRRRPL